MQSSARYLLALVALVATAFSAVQANPVPVRVPRSPARLAPVRILTQPSSAPLQDVQRREPEAWVTVADW